MPGRLESRCPGLLITLGSRIPVQAVSGVLKKSSVCQEAHWGTFPYISSPCQGRLSLQGKKKNLSKSLPPHFYNFQTKAFS